MERAEIPSQVSAVRMLSAGIAVLLRAAFFAPPDPIAEIGNLHAALCVTARLPGPTPRIPSPRDVEAPLGFALMIWPRRATTLALLCCASLSDVRAQTGGADGSRPTASDRPWTIVTMAPDGSFGVATETYIYRGIAEAVSNCKRMSLRNIGCGAQLQATQAGWIIAIRCGGTNIIAAGTTLADTVRSVGDREQALRSDASNTIPPCTHVVTVNPYGTVLRDSPHDAWDGPAISRANDD